MDFTDKVVLLTGASTAIGRETALFFSKLGAKLALTSRSIEKLSGISKSCEFFSKVPPLIIKTDLNNPDDVQNAIETTIKTFLTIDILINNASVLEYGSLNESTLEQYDRLFSLNVRSVFYLTKLALPYLIESKGTIVTVSSLNGLRSFTGLIVYNMSKSAIDQFTNSLALELAEHQVRVNSVNPGPIAEVSPTGLSEDDTKSLNDFMERCKETHPGGRAGNPEEVASVIGFLASNRASYINGVNLSIDGGLHAACPYVGMSAF